MMQKDESHALGIRSRFKTIIEENAESFEGKLVQFDAPEAILSAPADAFVEQFVGADRALKRLARMSAAAAMTSVVAALPAQSIAADATLRDALARMFASGDDTLAVVDADSRPLGILTLAAIRAHARAA